MGSPVLFRQARPGYKAKRFNLYKFRTMRCERDVAGVALNDNERLTTIGKILRKSSLDELPELWNVIRGDMSLVGPRPLLLEHLPFFTDWQHRRLEARPGITGWAQINGRNRIPFSKRIELDIWYLDNWSLLLDIRILLLTIPNILFLSGVVLRENDDDVEDIRIQAVRDSDVL